MKRTTLIILSVGGGLLLILFLAIYVLADDPVTRQYRELSERPVVVREVDDDVLAGISFLTGEEGALLMQGELSFEQILVLVRQKYAARIGFARVQVAMLEELMQHLQARYPETWVTMLQEILLAAFPDRATQLFQLSENLYQYSREMEGRRDLLGRVSQEERRELLWQSRYEHFGPAADEIWESEKRLEGIQSRLAAISKNEDLSLQDKLGAYRGSLEDAFGEQTEVTLSNRRLSFVNAFTDAVQSELEALNPEERAAALREIRSGLGMDAAALDRWSALDAERDQRWSNGEIYTSRRQEIAASYAGAEQEQRLDELRRELFGDEAEILKREEASGYFRYEQPRTIGRE
ncbi:MAG: hypothetical protein NXI24_14875 [bacterium]|nr:hypothetical protein [bacterium]